MREKILIVSNNQEVVSLIEHILNGEGFITSTMGNGEDVMRLLVEKEVPDLIILSSVLPGLNGLTVCRFLKQDFRTSKIPIIMFVSQGDDIDIVLSFEEGADDCITLPLSPRELVSRTKAVLRRAKEGNGNGNGNGNGYSHHTVIDARLIQVNDLTIDLDGYTVTVKGKRVDLTPLELEILKILATNVGKVFTRDKLRAILQNVSSSISNRTLDVHICHLRKKIEDGYSHPVYIQTIKNVGYKFKDV